VVTATDAELERDIEPFRTLRSAPMGMTAHVVYTAWDPARPASLSPVVIGEIIRGRIGFEGFLMTDDLGMHALSGNFGTRARAAIEAGCDAALHCSGELEEMIAVANAVGPMSDQSMARLAEAMATIADGRPAISYAEAAAKRDSLLAYA